MEATRDPRLRTEDVIDAGDWKNSVSFAFNDAKAAAIVAELREGDKPLIVNGTVHSFILNQGYSILCREMPRGLAAA